LNFNVLKDKLCLSYLNYTNKTHYGSLYELPNTSYNGDLLPDYLALYGDINEYKKTNKTFVCFYEYDNVFNNRNGLLSALLFNNKRLLSKFKERFKDVAGFISPDYSIYESIPKCIKITRTFETRLVSCYLVETFKKPCIPNISLTSINDMDFIFDGIDKHSIIAISLKGRLKEEQQRKNLKECIKLICDYLEPKTIVIYNVCTNNELVNEVIYYPLNKSINIILRNNLLLERNKILKEIHNYGC